MNNTLYVVSSIYNYKNDPLIYKVYTDFINRLKLVDKIKIYTVECLLPQQSSSILNINENHFIFKINNPFINTHNLQNVAIKQLPIDWQYVIYLDSDIEFINDDWVEKTIKALDEYSIVNPYTHATRINKDGTKGLVLRSFGYMYNISGNKTSDSCNEGYYYDEAGGWWPGYAIAINRNFYDSVGGLFDKTISGKNDIVTFCSITDNIDQLKKINQSKGLYNCICNYRDKIKQFNNFKGTGYADNKIIHHYHGDYNKRNYDFMDSLYQKYQFNPTTDFTESPLGVLNLNLTNDRQLNLRNDLIGYFNKRFN